MSFKEELIRQNFLLVRFIEITKIFKQQLEEDNFAHFGSFHVRREEILGEYLRIEGALEDQLKRMKSGGFSDEEMKEFKREYEDRTRLLNVIRELDQWILNRMLVARDSIGDELRSNRKNRSHLDRFKSSETTTGNELDLNL